MLNMNRACSIVLVLLKLIWFSLALVISYITVVESRAPVDLLLALLMLFLLIKCVGNLKANYRHDNVSNGGEEDYERG